MGNLGNRGSVHAHLISVDPDRSHVCGSYSSKREEAELPLTTEYNALVLTEETRHPTGNVGTHRQQSTWRGREREG